VSTVTDRTVIELHPSWFDESQIIKQAPDMGKLKRQKAKTKSRTPKAMETAVIIPDIQVGYYDYSIEPTIVDLQPIHDEKAISIGLAVISDLQPELIVMNGDNLDFEEVGKYDKSKAYERMLQPAIDRMAEFLRQLREAAPTARIVWIEGNHEKRLQKYLNERAPALVGIRKGRVSGEGRAKYPVISVSELCRVEDFDVEYLVGYPASRFSINKNLYVIHGDKVNSSGSTAGKYLPSISQSVIYGHIHRMELSMVTRVTEQGSRTIMAASFGTWCRIDGAVPSVKGGQDELMWIIDGRAVFRGKEYIAE
jgi:metallophosphoesterase superfamily enzyme